MDADLRRWMDEADRAEARGDLEEALRCIRRCTASCDAPEEAWWRQGRLLADLGRFPEAVKALQGVLHRRPDHLEALEAIVEVASQVPGFLEEAQEAIDRAQESGVPDPILRPWRSLLTRRPAPPEEVPSDWMDPEQPDLELVPEESDLARFLVLFGGREDVHARQWYFAPKDRGGYSPVHEPLTPSVLLRHFLGEVTLGVYPVRLDGTCLFAALDLDIPRVALEAVRTDRALARRIATDLHQTGKAIRDHLESLGFTVIVEDSGYKGRHFWIPFDQPVPVFRLRDLWVLLMPQLESMIQRQWLSLEWFPKQAGIPGGKGLGNLIKLPLGVHRRSGRRSAFLDRDFKPIAKPFSWLRTIRRTPASLVASVIERLSKEARGDASAPGPQEVQPAQETQGIPEPTTLPAPPAPPPPWTEADFDHDRDVSDLLASCPVLKDLVRRGLEHRRLDREERLVLRHTLGHLPSGLLAYNYLHDLTEGAPADRLVSVLRGNPVSCQKARTRVLGSSGRLCVQCNFPWALQTYPHPLLHLENPDRRPSAPQPEPDETSPVSSTSDNLLTTADLEREVRRFTTMEQRLRALQTNRDALARRLAMLLRGMGDPRVVLPEGTLELVVEQGLEVLAWTPIYGGERGTVSAPEGADESLSSDMDEAGRPEPAPAFRVVAGASRP